jgi:GT2 family glycosyltransferase
MFTNKTSLIIPTKNRSDHLIKLLNRLKTLDLNFNELLIVDSSDNFHSHKISFECKKRNIKYFKTKASTSFQRNFGINHINQNEFVMFMDDDVILLDDTFEKMNNCIEKFSNDKNIGGFGFNQIEYKKENVIDKFKSLKLFEYLNIYPSTPGKIAKSGWQSKIMNLENDILGDWVFTTMCIYKFEDIREFKFDETFGEYSYLEDLDFSLNLMNKNKKIYISSDAKFLHPENIDRSSFKFGIIEIKNRSKIVDKHNLSKKLFLLGALIRFFMSLAKSLTFNKRYFLRSIGNICSIFILDKKK